MQAFAKPAHFNEGRHSTRVPLADKVIGKPPNHTQLPWLLTAPIYTPPSSHLENFISGWDIEVCARRRSAREMGKGTPITSFSLTVCVYVGELDFLTM